MPVSFRPAGPAAVRIGVVAALCATLTVPNVLLGAADAHAATGGTALTTPVLTDVPSTASTVSTRVGNPCNSGGLSGAACNSNVTLNYGSGDDLRLDGFTASGRTYRVVAPEPGDAYTEIYRVDNATVRGTKDLIFIGRKAGDPYTRMLSTDPSTMSEGDVLGSPLITQGSDNTFANANATNINDIERISFLRTRPIVSPDASRAGLTVLERGGNDATKLAAVLAVDANGTPTRWGPIVDVPTTTWGTVLSSLPSTVLAKSGTDTEYRPTDSTGAQRLAGFYITFAELGVAAAEPVYGVSMLPNDATSPEQANPSLTTNGDSQGGIDLIGGVFSSSNNPVANPASDTGPQGRAQTLPLSYEAGDTLTRIDRTRTVLEAPAGGTVSADGLRVDVPGEGRYVLDRATDTVRFTPDPAFIGTATPVLYRVYDELNGTTTSTVTPTLTPVALPDTSSGPQGVRQSGRVLDNDGTTTIDLVPGTLRLIDASGNAVTTLAVPGQGTYRVVSGDVQFTPEPDFVGTATPVRYQVDDTLGNAVASTYTPTVTAVTPIANPDYTSGPQGVAQSVDPLANDNAGDRDVALVPSTLTLLDTAGNPATSVVVANQGTYTIANGKIVFTPIPTFTGAATPVTYRIADENGTTDTSTYTPQFEPVSPGSSPDTTTGPQGAPQTIDLLDNDEAGDAAVPLVASSARLIDPATGNPAATVTIAGEGRYTLVNGTVTFRPEPGFTGAGTRLSYTVADANGTITISTYQATVTPVLVADTSTGPQGVAQSVDPLVNDDAGNTVRLVPATLTLVDPDTGTATTTPVTIPGEGTYSIVAGRIVFTPEKDFAGRATPIGYRVDDADGNTLGSTYTPTLVPVAPTATPDTTSGPQGVAQSVDPLANDVAGDPAVALDPTTLRLIGADGNPTTSVERPDEGTYTIVAGRIVFTPLPTFTGEAAPVTYSIADVNGVVARSTYTPTVTAAAPTANPDRSTGPQGKPQSVDPFGNDEPGDAAVPLNRQSLALLDADGNLVDTVTVDGEGTYSVSDGRIVFTPVPAFTGVATPVTYRVSDTNGTTASSTYTPTVTAAPPAADVVDVGTISNSELGTVGDPVTIDVGRKVPALVPASLRLRTEDDRAVSRLEVPGQGTWTVDPDGRITFTPAAGVTIDPDRVPISGAEANGTRIVGFVVARYRHPGGASTNSGGGVAQTGPVGLSDQLISASLLLVVGVTLALTGRRRRRT